MQCGAHLPDGGLTCFSCSKDHKKHYDFIRSSAVFQDTIKHLIHKFKYQGKDFLNPYLSSLLINTFRSEPVFRLADVIIPVPMHWMKEFARGYNQSELLAKEVSRKLSIRFLPYVLIKSRLRKPQTRLKKEDRRLNAEGSYKVLDKDKVKNKTVILVDDVCTTSSTINECARVLKDAGAKKVFGLTIAHD